MAELKPCRFCNEKDYLTVRSEKLFDMDFYYGYCHICCARGPMNCDKEKAIEYWNNGVKDTIETTWSPQVDVWNKRSESMKEGWVCHLCGRVYGPMMMTCAYCNAQIDAIHKIPFVATINAEKTGE